MDASSHKRANPKRPGALNQPPDHDSDELRQRAEQRLQARRTKEDLPAAKQDTLRLLHELQVRQIELEMQNEELLAARAEAEAGLKQYTELYDFAPVGYLTIDGAGRILEANLTAARMLGVERVALVRKQELSHFVAREAQNEWLLYRHGLFAGEAKRSCQLTLRRDGGVPFFAEVESVALAHAADRPPRALVALTDISERRQIEDALRFLAQCGATPSGGDFFQALARYLAQSLGMDYVCIDRLQEGLLTAQTVAVYFNGKFEDNVSYTLKNTPCGDVVDKQVCCFPRNVRHLFPLDAVLQEMQAESYLGTLLWSSPGQPNGLIAVIGRRPLAQPELAQSILQLAAVRAGAELERRQAEEARDAAYRRTVATLESIGDGFFSLDRQWRVTYINARGARLLGKSREELLGKNLWESFPQTEALPFRKAYERALAEQALTSVEAFFPPLNAWFEARAHPTPEGLSVFYQDITERKQAEEQIRQASEELARSNKDLEQFAYVASHDLKEPLRMVSSFTGLLQERYRGKLDAKAEEYIGFAVDGAVRMQRLIEDLLTYSRVAREKTLVSTDVAAVVDDALRSLRAAIEESGTAITRDPLPTLKANAVELAQVFQNLIGNAIKFRRPDFASAIHVGAYREEGRWVLSVRDNGIGVPAEQFARIFEVFQRLHPRDEYPGTGIGLAIVKKIVERHGGVIWLESEVGKGTTFFFTLPD